MGERNIAIRFSEKEGIDTVLSMKGLVSWVWVDCFTQNPLTPDIYTTLKMAGFKLCFVSPELQAQPHKIKEYKDYFDTHSIHLDMVCTKIYNVEKWTNKVQIVIPMSGLGKRFVEAGYNVPKPLIVVDGKPIIEHVTELFPGETDVQYICNDLHLKTTNMREILTPLGRIHEVSVHDRQGPVHAVSQIFDSIDDEREVIVSYCDYGTDWDYAEFLRDTRSRNADGAVACYRGFHPHMLGSDNYAFLRETESGSRWMAEIQEKKPFTENRMAEYASNGTYYFKTGAILKRYFRQLMEKNERVNGEFYVSMVYNLLVADGLHVNIFEIRHMLQWGTPYDLRIYNEWSRYFSNVTQLQPEYVDNWNTTLILPMAGAGSRFSKVGYQVPKPLLDVDGLPMIVQAVKCIPASTHHVFVCLKKHAENTDITETIRHHFQNTQIVTVPNITEGQACTTEIGILKSNVDLDRPILVSACDNGVYYDVAKYQKLVDDPSVDVIVWSFRNHPSSRNHPNMYAWMETDETDTIVSVSCKKFKPEVHDLEKSHVIIGTMFFRKAQYFMDGLHHNYSEQIRTNGEFYVDDVINQNICAGLKVKVFEVENYICWGTPDDYETYLYWKRYFAIPQFRLRSDNDAPSGASTHKHR